MITLKFSEALIQGPFLIDSITKPWLSKREFYAHSPTDKIPTPLEWINLLAKSGFDVVWRVGGGESKAPEDVPYPNYEGWFLQAIEKVQSTQFGIFFSNVLDSNGHMAISVVKYDPGTELIWMAMFKIMAEKANVTINCGNCKLSGDQWLSYLENNKLPY